MPLTDKQERAVMKTIADRNQRINDLERNRELIVFAFGEQAWHDMIHETYTTWIRQAIEQNVNDI